MTLTVNDIGTFQTTAGTTQTTVTASSITGTNGNLMVLLGFFDQQDAGSANPTMSIGGTWSGTWTMQESVYRGTHPAGTYKEGFEIWTAPISGSPSGTITYNNPLTITDGWMGFHLFELSGQHASPIGLHANGGDVVSASTYTTDLGSAPSADSLVLGGVYDNNQAGPAVVQPTGWSESDEQSPAWGAIVEWAYKNGSAVQAPQWSGFTNSAATRLLGCSIEILAAAGGVTGPPPGTLQMMGMGV